MIWADKTKHIPEDRESFENFLENNQTLHALSIRDDFGAKENAFKQLSRWWFSGGLKSLQENGSIVAPIHREQDQSIEISSQTPQFWNELNVTDITVRDYQHEIFERAKRGNVICFLDTGGGKTRIAIKLILHRLKLMQTGQIGHKWIIFLVPTTHLAEQQKNAIEREIPCLRVRKLIGEHGTDQWQPLQWKIMFEQYWVLVMTAQILVSILEHGYKKITDFDLIIFDECHHIKGKKAVTGHPYSVIMDQYHNEKKRLKKAAEKKAKEHKEDEEEEKEENKVKLPKIFGLTATLLQGKVKTRDQVFRKVWELEWHLDCKTVMVDKFTQELSKIVSKPKIVRLTYISPNLNGVKQIKIPMVFESEQTHDMYKRWIKSINRIALSMGYYPACVGIRLLFKKLYDACQDSMMAQLNKMKKNSNNNKNKNNNNNNNDGDIDLYVCCILFLFLFVALLGCYLI